MKQEEFNQERARRYHLAMEKFPNARISELENLSLDETLSKKNLTILDLGTGDGFLTNYLLKKFPNAKIYALDSSKSMLSEHKNHKVKLINSNSDNIPLKKNSVDLVVSLASFHHINKKQETFKEINRILKKDGLFLLADVFDNTKTQEFFDSVIRQYCITGHDFPFLNKNEVKTLSNSSNLFHIKSELKNTPWIFKNREEMSFFFRNLFGLDISEDLLLKILFEHFPINLNKNNIELSWELGYHLIKKSDKTQRIASGSKLLKDEKDDFIKIIQFMPWLYNPILDSIPKNDKIQTLIDVGCGNGHLINLISKRFSGIILTGIDIDDYFINKARERYNFNFLIGNASKFKKKADVVICNLALHHFDNPENVLKNLYNNAKKILIISDQIRPLSNKDLEIRLNKRKEFVGDNDVSYYSENEKSSILEAYNKEEIKKILQSLNIPFTLKFFDNDYYERFVAIFEKEVKK